MKPRINLRFGIWGCFTFTPRAFGCGRSPVEAYAEWRQLFLLSSRRAG